MCYEKFVNERGISHTNNNEFINVTQKSFKFLFEILILERYIKMHAVLKLQTFYVSYIKVKSQNLKDLCAKPKSLLYLTGDASLK